MARRTAHEGSVDRIAGWICSGRFPPGAVLPTEPELGAELGVSRTVVREAVKALAAKGMVETRPRTGTRVRTLADWHAFDPSVVGWLLKWGVDRATAIDLTEMRLAIEPFAAELAARRRSTDDTARMRSAYARMDAATLSDDWPGYVAADLEFHQALIAATSNRFFIQLAPAIQAVLALSFELSVTSLLAARASLPNHLAVLEGIERRDGAGARAALEDIINSAGREILDRLEAPGAGASSLRSAAPRERSAAAREAGRRAR